MADASHDSTDAKATMLEVVAEAPESGKMLWMGDEGGKGAAAVDYSRESPPVATR